MHHAKLLVTLAVAYRHIFVYNVIIHLGMPSNECCTLAIKQYLYNKNAKKKLEKRYDYDNNKNTDKLYIDIWATQGVIFLSQNHHNNNYLIDTVKLKLKWYALKENINIWKLVNASTPKEKSILLYISSEKLKKIYIKYISAPNFWHNNDLVNISHQNTWYSTFN